MSGVPERSCSDRGGVRPMSRERMRSTRRLNWCTPGLPHDDVMQVELPGAVVLMTPGLEGREREPGIRRVRLLVDCLRQGRAGGVVRAEIEPQIDEFRRGHRPDLVVGHDRRDRAGRGEDLLAQVDHHAAVRQIDIDRSRVQRIVHGQIAELVEDGNIAVHVRHHALKHDQRRIVERIADGPRRQVIGIDGDLGAVVIFQSGHVRRRDAGAKTSHGRPGYADHDVRHRQVIRAVAIDRDRGGALRGQRARAGQ